MTPKIEFVFLLSVCFICGSIEAVMNSNGHDGFVRTLASGTHGESTLNIGAGIGLQQSSGYIKGLVESGVIGNILDVNKNVINPNEFDATRLLSSNMFISIGALSFWDVALSFPYYYDWMGIEGVSGGGIGDLEFSTKLKIPSRNKVFSQATYLSASIPSGNKISGLFPRHVYFMDNTEINPAESFYSSGDVTSKILWLMSLDFGKVIKKLPLSIHANIGAAWNFTNSKQSNTLIGGIALEYLPASFITLFVDLYCESQWSNVSSSLSFRHDPLLLSPGVKFSSSSGLYVMFSGDFSLSSSSINARLNWNHENYKYSTSPVPHYGMQIAFGWNGFIAQRSDEDQDGVKNDKDKCPREAEDRDGFEDEDGCPDLDNDNDGILDVDDKCQDEPEDKDGFEDEDGCPDEDNDNDGVLDVNDKCPNDFEDKDGFEDEDGCPDEDNDNDGIDDSVDKCPDKVEDFDNFEDEDGCPDEDNDDDGIVDIKDLCPSEPETFNNYKDEDGCPDIVRTRESNFPRHQIVYGVSFQTGSEEMTFESYQYLDPIIKQLVESPEVEIEVHGHTDSDGNYDRNMELSQLRAESVCKYIISRGVASSRVRAVGLGPKNPVGDNKTAEGRTKNRRIEIVRTK